MSSSPPGGSPGETLVGRTLNGVYRLVDLIGTGGFADVYLARDLRTNVTVAVKILHAHVAREAGLVQRFATEADVARRLTGPNVARALDTGQDVGSTPFIVMEYVQGLSLAEIIRRRGPLPIQESVRLIDQVLAALSEAHALGIIHRDIKPANLMVDASGVLKVMDFGIARLLEGGGSTAVGQVLGTPAYMAPEQVSGQPVDARTDLYAVGIVLYELLAGTSPFSGTSDHMAMMARVVNEAPAPIQTLRADVPPGLVAVLDRALAKAPDWRFQTATEMRQALAVAIMAPPSASPTAQLPPLSPPGQSWPPAAPMAAHPVPPPPSPPYMGPSPSRPQSPRITPILLGIGAVALLVLGGLIGLLSSRGFFGTVAPTPTVVAVVPPTATSAPTPTRRPSTPVPTVGNLGVPTEQPATPAAPTAPPKPTTAPTSPPPPPPPPTATPPPEPTTPPVRPTATPFPNVAYQADFSEGSGRLYTGKDDESEHLVWQGEYVIKTLTTEPASSGAFIPGAFNDGTLATSTRIVGGSDYSYVALGCREQNTLRTSRYEVNLALNPPRVRLARFDDGDFTTLTAWTENPAILGGSTWNRLELRCVGPVLSVVVNGQDIIAIRDEKYQAGRWLIRAGTFGDKAGQSEGRFDDVELRTR